MYGMIDLGMEYVTSLDESSIALSIVDSIRSSTDAPMNSCIQAAISTLTTINDNIKSCEKLDGVLDKLVHFNVNVNECRDGRDLNHLKNIIIELCMQKEELTNTVRECDDSLIESLRVYCDILRKTLPEVAQNEVNDLEVVKNLVELYVKEQKEVVSLCIIESIEVIASVSPSIVITFLADSPLLVSLSSRLSSTTVTSSQDFDKMDISILSLMSKILSSSSSPPIDTLQFLDIQFAYRLWNFFHNGCIQSIHVLVLLHKWRLNDPSTVILALSQNPHSNIGEKLIEYCIREPSKDKFELLEGIFSDTEIVSSIFYSNDLGVLMHVCGQHLLNEENEDIRRSILKFFIIAGSNGYGDCHAIESVESCTMNDPLVDEARQALVK